MALVPGASARLRGAWSCQPGAGKSSSRDRYYPDVIDKLIYPDNIYRRNREFLMNPGSAAAYIAFEGDRCLASGDLRSVIGAVTLECDRRGDASILVFDGATGGPIDIDFR